MATEDTDTSKTPAQDVATEEQDTASVATSGELNKADLEEVSGGLIRI
ncbi:MAG TPA: hypothetical protein VH353_13915 [Caulobacteraceae bacterium]|jgi:hypothetical protein|nr:hypothetical protein [Caulobacteraceae bacterium]